MRVKGATVQQFLLGLALVAAVCWNLAHAGELRSLQLNSGATGTRAELRLDREADYQLISLANPDRLVVDLPGSSPGRSLQLPAATGVVKGVRSGQPMPGTTRIVFDLATPVVALKPHYESGVDGPRLVLEWPDDGAHASVANASEPAASAPIPDATADTTAPDAAITSAAATSRLIASLPASQSPVSQLPASPSRPQPIAGGASLPRSVPTLEPISTRIATGVPTRVATGVPADPMPPAPASSVVPAYPQAPGKTMQDIARRGGLRPLIIAIDAGHGGQDPGARGPGGSREKMITLSIARELARQVNATPGLKAYLTRDTDVFIPLTQRYQKARAAKADLFVSIHADSFTNPDANGSSVFVLSQRGASSQAARWLASQENAADLVGGVKLQGKDDTLASVLLDLSQSATMKASEDMANQVLGGLKRLGRTHKQEIERANFVVLRSPDVPSMLVETAFISNPEEERRLNDPRHQEQLARAILDGVNTYFTRQPPPGTLYAARADAGGSGSAIAGGGSP
ncbi:MAG: N-acetylmuramoyl-L-alanine amidase [Luteimonas sp.]